MTLLSFFTLLQYFMLLVCYQEKLPAGNLKGFLRDMCALLVCETQL